MSQTPEPVIGRIHWTANGTSPWVLFPSLNAYRTWARKVRTARPGTKTEFEYIARVSPEYLLESAREQRALETRHTHQETNR